MDDYEKLIGEKDWGGDGGQNWRRNTFFFVWEGVFLLYDAWETFLNTLPKPLITL